MYGLCGGRTKYDDEYVEGKSIIQQDLTIYFPDGAVGMLDIQMGQCPKAVAEMLTDRGATAEYRSFVKMLTQAPAGGTSCCAAGIAALTARKMTAEQRQENAVEACKPHFAKHSIHLYLCRRAESNKPISTWFSFVDRTRNMDYIPEYATAENGKSTPSPFAAGNAKPQAPPKSVGSAVDFTGSWLNTRFEGDMDHFMTDMGVGYMVRTAASAAGYGVGKQVQKITQSGDSVTVEIKFPKEVKQSFHINAGEQPAVTLAGDECDLAAWWGEDGVLFISSKDKSGTMLPFIRRYFKGEEMVMELKTSHGVCVKRYFTKQ